MEQQSFLEKEMSNYHFSQQSNNFKQASQILTPLPLQQSNYTIVRSSLTDRSQHDPKTHHALLSPVPINMPILSREGSYKHLHENNRPMPPTVIQSRSSGGIENQMTFSDYQIGHGVRAEEQLLPVGGGYNISSKIGEKIKHKTDLHKSSSKATLNGSELNKTPSIRHVQSVIQADKGEFTRLENIIQIINSQITKISEKVNNHEQKIERLEKNNKKGDDGNESGFTTPQMEEINKILSLVEKSQQRDDYRKTMKMIEELRTAILELNTEIKSISESHQTLPDKNERQLLKKQVLEILHEKNGEIRQGSQLQVKQLAKRLSEMEEQWKNWMKDQSAISSITSSVKKFQGKMTTLHYEQRISPSYSHSTSHNLTTGIAKQASIASLEKQSNAAILTSKTYYIDSSGYLLDKNKYYLLNHRNEQIRLTQKEIQLLRKHNIL